MVRCATHGESEGGFVCCHLVHPGSSRLGFNYAYGEEPDALCPDAWCNQCHEVLEREDGWTEEATQHADIKLVCDSCFGDIRQRNWIQDENHWDDLVRGACEWLTREQDVFLERFKIGEHQRYDWDQGRAELVFSNDGKPAVICDIAFVGSVSTQSKTWMWSWANSSNEEPVKAPLRAVRRFGEEHNLERIAGAYWTATPEDGWHMTAIAARQLNAIGAYRCPADYGFLYLVVLGARWVE